MIAAASRLRISDRSESQTVADNYITTGCFTKADWKGEVDKLSWIRLIRHIKAIKAILFHQVNFVTDDVQAWFPPGYNSSVRNEYLTLNIRISFIRDIDYHKTTFMLWAVSGSQVSVITLYINFETVTI